MTKITSDDGKTVQVNGAPRAAPAALKVEPTSENLTLSRAEGEQERIARLREERSWVSMSIPSMKMQVPEIPGYHCHWINDYQGRVEKAIRAKYEFVDADEVELHDFSLAGDSTKTGNQDLGTRVSMVVGTDEGGKPMRAYLMKLREELWKIDQELQQRPNDEISQQLKRGKLGAQPGMSPEDAGKTYVKTVEVRRRDIQAPVSFGEKSADI
jgi:hypothetical protein